VPEYRNGCYVQFRTQNSTELHWEGSSRVWSNSNWPKSAENNSQHLSYSVSTFGTIVRYFMRSDAIVTIQV